MYWLTDWMNEWMSEQVKMNDAKWNEISERIKMNEWKSAGQAKHEGSQDRASESQSTYGWDPPRKLWPASKHCLSIRQTPCRQKVEAMTLKCFNKQYCVMKSQYKQISMLKLKKMSNTKLLSWLRVFGVSSTLSSNSKIIDCEEVKTFSSSQSYWGTLGQI